MVEKPFKKIMIRMQGINKYVPTVDNLHGQIRVI
jgi:hypothetical protein